MKNETRQRIQEKTAKKLSKIYTICVLVGVLIASFIPDLSNSILSMSPILRETTRIGLVIFWIWLTYIIFYRIIMEAYEKQDEKIADYEFHRESIENVVRNCTESDDKYEITIHATYYKDVIDMFLSNEIFTNDKGYKYVITLCNYNGEFDGIDLIFKKYNKED